jgi:hypothetical protein
LKKAVFEHIARDGGVIYVIFFSSKIVWQLFNYLNLTNIYPNLTNIDEYM